MNSIRVVRLTVAAFVVLLPLNVYAQQASGIAGVARDTSGAVLPGVTVEASSPALIEKVRTVVTDGEGRFLFRELTAGSYTITASAAGATPASFGATSFTYSDGGQMMSEDGPWSDDAVSFSYNKRLRQSMTIAAPNASPWLVTYQYDAGRRLTNVVSGAGAFGYQYHPGIGGGYDSPLWQTLTFPGGAYVSRAFDSAGRVQSTSLLNSTGGVLDSHSYGFDAAGRATNHVRFDNSSVAYTYDNAGQLKTA